MRRIFRRLLPFLVVVLAVLTLATAGLTWFAFWPLEGSVERIESLIPATVDFVYKGSWQDRLLRQWVDENVVERPLVDPLRDAVAGFEAEVLPELRRFEEQINASIPLNVAKFSVEKDLFPAEIVAAGRWCEGWSPERGLPTWREVLLMTRVSWKTRFVSALKHEFIRTKIGGGVTIESAGEGVYRLILHSVAVSSVQQRSGCGRGFVMPPENEWWLFREKDVLAVSNSRELIQEVAALARSDGAIGSFGDRPGFELATPPGTIAAAADLGPLQDYLVRGLEVLQRDTPQAGLLERYLTLTALDRMNGSLSFPLLDRAVADASVLYDPADLLTGLDDVYRADPRETRAALASLVPADDTFALLLLETPPQHLLRAVHEEFLSESERRLWRDNLRSRTQGYADVDALLADVASRLGTSAAIAVGRISEVFDGVEYPEWFPGDEPSPMPGVAFMVRIKHGADPAEVDEFLATRAHLMGLKVVEERGSHAGISYRRLELEQRTADLELVSPAYVLHSDHLIIANNEAWFRKILETIQGGASLEGDNTYRATMNALHDRVHLALFLDLDKLHRVPATDADTAPRGYLWDRRNEWVRTERDPREAILKYRRQQTANAGGSPDAETALRIDEAVERFAAEWEQDYPLYVEEYREELQGMRRLRSAGLSLRADRTAIQVRAVLLLDAEGTTAP
jgi:hypothetical protein